MSALPAVIDALVALPAASDLAALDGLQVFDGPEAGEQPASEFLAVGLTPEDLTTSGVRSPAGIQASTDAVEVTCWARVWSGDSLIKPLRDRAFAIVDAVIVELARDPSLGGACSHAEVVDVVYAAAQDPATGCVVDVLFTVQARQF